MAHLCKKNKNFIFYITETFDYGWIDAFMKGVILSMNILMSASKITIFYISE